MRTVGELRAALDDAGTPAGIDLAAVRGRARRRRMVVAAAAGLIVAVAVPATLLAWPPSAPPATVLPVDSADAVDCPNRLPAPVRDAGPGLAGRLVPFPVNVAVVCDYGTASVAHRTGLLAASRMLPAQTARDLVAWLETGNSQASSRACSTEVDKPIFVRFAGDRRTVLVELDLGGCPTVSNGARTMWLPRPVRQDLLAALRAGPDRLTCPDRTPVEPLRIDGKASGPLVPVHVELMLVCRYTGDRRFDPSGVREIDGQAARDAIGVLESRPLFLPIPCPSPGKYSYLVLVRGQGRTVTLVGSNSGCHTLSSAGRTVWGVDWPALLGR